MNEQQFLKGWHEQRVKRFLAELAARTDEEWIAADEAAADSGGKKGDKGKKGDILGSFYPKQSGMSPFGFWGKGGADDERTTVPKRLA